MPRAARRNLIAALLALAAPVAGAQSFDFATPSHDRWQYPFNFSPGTRPTASVFSSLGTGVPGFTGFNDRDGIVLIAWDTSTLIAPGQGRAAYRISSIRVTLRSEPGAAWPIDTTPDEWFTTDADNDAQINVDGVPRGEPGDTDGESDDADPGRPIELFGVGFGPFFTAATWTEFGAYVGGSNLGNGPRDPYPLVFQSAGGAALHVEDHVKGLHNAALPEPVFQFTPTPWAVGIPVGYTPGAQATPFDVTFEVALDETGTYFAEQLNAGRVLVAIASLTDTVMGGTPGGVPSFYMKEGLGLHPDARAPQLTIVLAAGQAGDTNGDGCVNLSDLGVVLSNFGLAVGGGAASGDFDNDGDVDLSDLGVVLSAFGQGC